MQGLTGDACGAVLFGLILLNIGQCICLSVPCCWFDTACWFYSLTSVQHISGCGEFQHPCDIAVDYKRDDRLIVTDFNNNRVQVRVRATMYYY